MENSREKKIVRTYRDLNVFQVSYSLAMKIFEVTKTFPKEERYSLTDQIRRSSRSVPVNICEGWAKRKYKNVFLRHLIDSTGSCEETKVWLDFAKDCKYIKLKEYEDFIGYCREVGAMLNALINKWQTF